MTYKEFLKELAKTKGQWHIGPSGKIRCKKGYCPIIAIAVKKKIKVENWAGQKYQPDNGDWMEVADVLKIGRELADKIVAAADYSYGDCGDCDCSRCAPGLRTKQIRRDLLRVLGLKEKKNGA